MKRAFLTLALFVSFASVAVAGCGESVVATKDRTKYIEYETFVDEVRATERIVSQQRDQINELMTDKYDLRKENRELKNRLDVLEEYLGVEYVEASSVKTNAKYSKIKKGKKKIKDADLTSLSGLTGTYHDYYGTIRASY